MLCCVVCCVCCVSRVLSVVCVCMFCPCPTGGNYPCHPTLARSPGSCHSCMSRPRRSRTARWTKSLTSSRRSTTHSPRRRSPPARKVALHFYQSTAAGRASSPIRELSKGTSILQSSRVATSRKFLFGAAADLCQDRTESRQQPRGHQGHHRLPVVAGVVGGHPQAGIAFPR